MSPNPRPAIAAARFLAVLDALADCPGIVTTTVQHHDSEGTLVAALHTWARSRNLTVAVEDGISYELVIRDGVRVFVHDWSEPAVKEALANWRPSDSEVANGA